MIEKKIYSILEKLNSKQIQIWSNLIKNQFWSDLIQIWSKISFDQIWSGFVFFCVFLDS
jgi:hypothetical protein